ncbi:MAG: hypothetical protein HC900_00990 [Methylacidiphilales bacterium]|nr:hypothetical protein [Candidatus Methylacidiphilales bacterium]
MPIEPLDHIRRARRLAHLAFMAADAMPDKRASSALTAGLLATIDQLDIAEKALEEREMGHAD